VAALAVDPSDPSVVYAGAAGGGVWKTTNDGASWTPLFDSQPSLVIGAIAVDPVTTDTLYVGTGEGVLRGYYGKGIFKSTDGGATWNLVGGPAFDNCHVTDLVIHPTAPSIVLASVDAYMGNDGGSPLCVGGVYRSSNGGATWARTYTSTETGGFFDAYDFGVSDLAVDSSTPSRWYAAVSGDSVYVSNDGGRTWAPASTGFPTVDVGRIEMALAASAPQTLYAAVVNSASDQFSPGSSGELLGIWKSTDGAATWAQVATPTDVCGSNMQCAYDLTFSVDPADPERFYVGGVVLYRSDNGGSSYVLLDDNTHPQGTVLPHVDFHALAFDATGRLWIGSDGGVYRTADRGQTFSNLNTNLATIQVNRGISGTVSGPLFAGTQDNGTIKDPGTHAWNLIVGGDGGATAVDPTNPDVVYLQVNGRVYKSTNGGANISFVGADIPETDPSLGVGGIPMEMDPSNSATLYLGTNRVWRTTNGGSGWSPVSPDLGEPGFPQCCISAIGVAPGDPSTIYAGTAGGQVQVTRNGGASWANVSDSLPDALVSQIVVSTADSADAFVAVLGFGAGHVFHTTNAGASWSDISSNLPDVPAGAMALDARVDPPRMFLGTDRGVFASDNDGASWSRLAGIPNAVVKDLLFEPATGELVAATYGRGLFAASIPFDFVVPPPPPTHASVISLSLSRHLRARGAVDVPDGFAACMAGRVVEIQRKRGDNWAAIVLPTTRSDGSFSVRIEDRVGRYRAQIAEVEADGEICLAATSPLRRHRH
jgi:photosystem II stability/assembly factor-like uncharacterized protein